MKDTGVILENTIKRCRERNIIIPTYEEMAYPEKNPQKIKDELKNIGMWDLNCRNLFRITWKNEPVDFGGGFGPRYSDDQEPFPIKEYAEYIGKKLDESGLKPKAIAIEPGKFLVGDAGVLLLRVEYIKKSYGNLFACVDGGTFNTVPRPAIYTQAQHHIVNCACVKAQSLEKITVPGNLCETGDVFRKEIWMPPPKKGIF